jgi:ketosteroid isomerase-like protein
MKNWIVVLLCGLVLSTAGLSAAVNDPGEEKAVMAAMQAMVQGTIKKDIPALNKVYHEDLSYSHSSTSNQTKAEVLKAVSGTGIVESIKFSDTTIRIYGPVALVKGVTDMRNGRVAGKMNDNHLNILWVLVKGNQGWQIVARQTTRIPPPQ